MSFVSSTPWIPHYFRNTLTTRHPGLFKIEGAVDYLEKHMGARQIEDLKSPAFMAAVSDLDQKRTHFLQS
jgi:hypothetical protein